MGGLVLGMQIENRLAGGKPVRRNHRCQILELGVRKRIEFQDALPALQIRKKFFLLISHQVPAEGIF